MTIFFYCPRPPVNKDGIIPPSGGIYFIHRLVSLLNELGHPALVWTPRPLEVWWDAHPIRHEYIVETIQPGPADTVVIPEVNWPPAEMNGARQVLFVQNYIWLDRSQFIQHPGDTLVCSRFLANHMQRVFDARVIGMLTPYLDDDVWVKDLSLYTPKKSGRVMLLNRRNERLADKMRMALELSGQFEVDFITEPLSQRQLAAHFVDAEYYIHLVYPEGFPMVCLEAMRSGTLVVGTTGGGGNQFMFHGETAVCVQNPEDGRYFNEDEFVQRIMDQMLILRSDDDKRSRLWQHAYAFSKQYSAESTKKELKLVFG